MMDPCSYIIDVIDRLPSLEKRKYLMITFLFLIEAIWCDPSTEPSGSDARSSSRDGSDSGVITFVFMQN